jgi:hypothetical protein
MPERADAYFSEDLKGLVLNGVIVLNLPAFKRSRGKRTYGLNLS